MLETERAPKEKRRRQIGKKGGKSGGGEETKREEGGKRCAQERKEKRKEKRRNTDLLCVGWPVSISGTPPTLRRGALVIADPIIAQVSAGGVNPSPSPSPSPVMTVAVTVEEREEEGPMRERSMRFLMARTTPEWGREARSSSGVMDSGWPCPVASMPTTRCHRYGSGGLLRQSCAHRHAYEKLGSRKGSVIALELRCRALRAACL